MTRVINPPVEQSYKCYLIATIDPKTMKVIGVGTYSETPWTMTRHLGEHRQIMAIVLERSGSSFHEALRDVEAMYPVYEKDLAARFPLPGYVPEMGVRGISLDGVTTGRRQSVTQPKWKKKRS